MARDQKDGSRDAKERTSAELISELRRRERDYRERMDRLERALSRLTLFAFDQSPDLDKLLSQLRSAIRKEESGERIAELAQQSEKLIRQLGLPREEMAKTADGHKALRDLLDRLQFPRHLNRDVRDLRKRLDKAEPGQPSDEVLDEVAGLLGEAHPKESGGWSLKGILAGVGGHGAEGERLLRILLDEVTPPEELRTPFKHIRDALPEAGESDRLHLAETLAEALDDYFRHTLGLVDAEGRLPGEILRPFHHLLDALADADEAESELAAVRRQLYSPPEPEALPHLLAETADIMARVRASYESERKDLEGFLQGLATGLGDLGEQFRSTHDQHREASRRAQEHNAHIEEQMAGLANELKRGHDIEELKRAIQARLLNIREQVETHRRAEEQRDQDLESQVSRLRSRLRELEAESDQLREQLEQEREQAHTDALTGLPNRLGYQEMAQQAVGQWGRHGHALSLLIVDVDLFKTINDTYGHQAGDKALRAVAEVIQGQLQREADFVGRYGGEEFVALLPETNRDQARKLAEAMRQAVGGTTFTFQGQPLSEITLSIGVTEFQSGDRLEDAFERADQQVLWAKENGRNQVVAEPVT